MLMKPRRRVSAIPSIAPREIMSIHHGNESQDLGEPSRPNSTFQNHRCKNRRKVI
ncbi:rCG55608 [Rattus norvegicus]|uniref:RCG55608 n=1 Tax=Rattus norvegicus TaxID=10116 RepID=A6JR87_RAT|nr:rCG55608 [Rattus norvegicus]